MHYCILNERANKIFVTLSRYKLSNSTHDKTIKLNKKSKECVTKKLHSKWTDHMDVVKIDQLCGS